MTIEQQHDIEPALDLIDAERLDPNNVALATKTTSPKPRWLLLIGVIALLTGGIIVWRSVASSQQSADDTPPPADTANSIEQARLPVRTVPVTLSPIQSWTYGDGFVNATVKKHLSFQAEGTIIYLKKVNGRDLREGDVVRKGELLARVDRRKFDADIVTSEAGQIEAQNQVLDALASFRQSEESLAQAKTDLEKAKTDEAFAKSDLKRYQELAAEGAIEQREVEVKETSYKNTQAAVAAAEAGIRSAQAQVAAATTKVSTAKAGVQSAKARVVQSNVESEDTELVAPFDGIIARLNIRQGEYWTPQIVSPGGDYQNVVERLPIIVINPTQFEVNVDLPAFQGAAVKAGQRAFIILDRDRSKAISGQLTGQDLIQLASARGTVISVSPSVSPGERSVHVTIRIDAGASKLQDGEQVAAWIATQEKARAAVAPFGAFVFRDRQSYVFVVDETQGIVQQRAVKQGIEGLSKREILGVQIGEKLVTEGKNRLVNGAPVEIIP